ncbi:MAG: CLC_0170 family protein [Paenibacillus macerans]|uniref:Putative membrane protein n=1 Tax=Paenibacillus macerans TaxID=44252 RepID=A0A090ZBV8_PAEMA|nr:CLC_0170 family protein [Paenibacillus macerans]KFN08072.1 putative membrane protein [Paenibacillus macerans]MBS5909834.1 hypothetical protein [Paenibacillus macerans]MCY7556831.1 hypothetical protein [Paenibacillus macerans]MDU5945811.1 CLC_0170 family protein [Paenibacillus macerans]MDU7475156.1 CLC_0170 family protein [Paenibacillus macerans]
MIRVLASTSVMFLFSGLILLLVDKEIYKVTHMKKEHRCARFFGWAEVALSAAGLLTFLLLHALN